MNKITKILLIILVFTFLKLQFPTTSYAVYTKNSANPILNIGTTGQWDSLSISDPNVIYENTTNYKMWYSGTYANLKGSIGYATSIDGLLWTKPFSYPIYTKDISDSSELEVAAPHLIKIDNVYKMWYLSTTPYYGPGSEVYRIKLASSLNGIDNWTLHGFVFRRSSAAWESEGVVPNSVLFRNNKYEMWYSARNNTGIWRIGYADSNDGIHWNRQLNPVLIADQAWEGTTVASASVIIQNGIYHMYYHAGPVVPYHIGHAVSSDGINWTKDPLPILERGNRFLGDFDWNMIAAPSVIRVANQLRLYYAGHDGANWRIGLAEEFLPVPYFNQADMPWGDDEYDSASLWTDDPNYIDMASYGCAVTSAAMVLRHFNVHKTPGNPNTGLPAKNLTPETLNEWLINIEDGYFRNGVTNFDSIANMTVKTHDLDPTMPKLDYSQGFDTSSISSSLTNHQPVILKLGYPPSLSDMHFVVATTSVDSTYGILDPYYPDRTTLSPHYSNILRSDHLVPTNSDFSYLILAIGEFVNINLKDSNGFSVGHVELEKPIFDQITQSSSGAETLKLLYFKQPPQGNYTLELPALSNQSYQLDTYLYDQDGEGGLETFTGTVSPGDIYTFSITIDPENVENSEITQNPGKFSSLIENINTAYKNNWITNKGIYNSLLKKAINAQNELTNGNLTESQDLLNALLNELSAQRGKHVTENGYLFLYTATQNLLNSL